MEENKTSIFSNKSIQEYIYLSYLYLLIIGALSYTTYYYFLGINIINYSTVLDILLSPIIILTDNIKTPLFMFGYIFLIILVLAWIQKRNKKALLKETSEEKKEKLSNSIQKLHMLKFVVPVIGTFGFYIGFALGGGYKLSKSIENADLKPNKAIEFISEETVKVKLIGLNSQYVFYVLENDNKVSISPISGNVKTISPLNK